MEPETQNTFAPGLFSPVLHENGYHCQHLEYDQYPEKHVYRIAWKP